MFRQRRRAGRALCVVVAVLIASACGAGHRREPSPDPLPSMPVSGTATVEIGGRQVTVHVPPSYDPGRPAPLVVGLHGYTSNAKDLETYLGLTPEADRHGFVAVYPEGSTDDRGDRFWNATDACCAYLTAKPDDSRYLSELISAVEGSYRIDRARVYVVGHSNGGFMAFRTACDHADQIAAIVSINGASWSDAARCRPSEPVSVLAVHSDKDETVAFGGGDFDGVAYPSAATTVNQWLGYDRCADAGRDAANLDLVTDLPGAETSVRGYVRGCAGGSTVQSWTITGGTHVPHLGPAFAPAVADFLLARAKRR